ncbi:MAG TPA: hypothetical protein VGC18_07630 [Lacisediminihabitans sp.]|uniref:hypothetical protein n=1 Tax=Lacisediminihabitans sp. TaxID=2787631 RepID=UPI002ED9F82F
MSLLLRPAAFASAALVLAAGGILAGPLAADAATLGPGYQQGQPTNHLGGYLDPDGSVSYCINAGQPSALGRDTVDAGLVDRVGDLDPASMTRLNAVLSRHGNTSDNTTAAAVAMAVWSIAGNADYQAEGGDAFVLRRAPASERAAIQTLADRFRAEAASYTPPTGSATLRLEIDAGDDALGQLDVSVTPSSASGTVTLHNGLFVDTNSPTHAVTDGAHLAIRGTPASSEPYRITATSGDFTADGGPAAKVHLYATPSAQTLAASGGSVPLVFSASASDVADREVPAVTTVAQPTGVVGGTVTDTARATGVPSAGEQLTWAGYLQPPGSTTPICAEATRIYSSTAPLTITADGSYSSQPFPVTDASVGTVYWVETATVGGAVVAEGACGAPGETSILSPASHLPVVSG